MAEDYRKQVVEQTIGALADSMKLDKSTREKLYPMYDIHVEKDGRDFYIDAAAAFDQTGEKKGKENISELDPFDAPLAVFKFAKADQPFIQQLRELQETGDELEDMYDHTFKIGKIFAHGISLNKFSEEEMAFRLKHNIAVIGYEME